MIRLMIRLMSTPRIYEKIRQLESEQALITRDLYRKDLDKFSRLALDVREKELIKEMLELKTERMRRGRKIAESIGAIPQREKKS